MLVCYLDDSGTDPQNRITTIAGYAATEEQWREFETDVEPIFSRYGVAVFHAVEMEQSKGVFKDWTILKKQSFVAQICRTLSRHVRLGMSMSALKPTYKNRAIESQRKRTITPYSFCAHNLLEWAVTDIHVGQIANLEGLAFIFEDGSKHNAEMRLHLEGLRNLHPDLSNALKSISFVPKDRCRAIQMADLLAYYSHRHGVVMEAAPPEEKYRVRGELGTMLSIISESSPHRAFVATDFGPNIRGSRFAAGDP